MQTHAILATLAYQILTMLFLFSPPGAENMERDRFMSPQEALEFGLIDQVLEHPPLPEDNGTAKSESS